MSNTNLTPRNTVIGMGEMVPDFVLKDQDKNDWRLSDALKHGDVVLCLFPFAFTGVCGQEMQCVTREMDAGKKKGAQVVGMSCDSMFTLRAWADKEGFKHTLLSDQHRLVTKALGRYWADMNTTGRATIVVGKTPDGQGKVKMVQAREPGVAMKWEEVVAVIS